jgi:hypothetical protein
MHAGLEIIISRNNAGRKVSVGAFVGLQGNSKLSEIVFALRQSGRLTSGVDSRKQHRH